jgi:biopolymer transport protein ExbB
MGDPRVLSAGISEALLATAAGLCVAIPSLFAYRFLRGKVDRIVVQMEKEAMKLVDAIESGQGQATEEVRRRASG